jgi:hypothetical protein
MCVSISSRFDLLAAVDDAIRIAADARVPVVIYQPESDEVAQLAAALARINEARGKGLDIHTTMTPDLGPAHGARAYWLRDSGASVGSQSAAVRTEGLLAGKIAQSRAYDAFPTVLARYVREEHVISLGAAIQRMTSAAAGQFRLDGRGVIRVGSFADVIVFDPAAVNGRSTSEPPLPSSTGMHHVIVNGVPVLDATGLTGSRPGQGLFGRARGALGRAS